MANSILISSDMNDVYILDASGGLIFSGGLSGNGVIISLDNNNEPQGAAAQFTFPGIVISKVVTNAQWTLTYSATTKTAYIIGITDETIGLTEGNGFNLDGQSLQIKRKGDNINLIAG